MTQTTNQNTNEVIQIINNAEKNKKTFKDFLLDAFDMLSFLVFVGGIVLFIRFFLFNPYSVVGESMYPTFNEKDFIIVDKVTPKVSGFNRGDIIVFVPSGKDVPYIKRIVGLPGDIVKIQDSKTYICKKDSTGEKCDELKEPYLGSDVKTEAKCGISEFTVTSGSYFTMGDNRSHSTDSRCCFGLGCYSGSTYLVGTNDIIGKVSLRLFPDFNRF